MSRRFFIGLFCLLYASVAGVFSGLHHHHDAVHDHAAHDHAEHQHAQHEHTEHEHAGNVDCVACAWHASGNTDLPATHAAILPEPIFAGSLTPVTAPVLAGPFLPATASRAPPELT